jgi:hypothetical protein
LPIYIVVFAALVTAGATFAETREPSLEQALSRSKTIVFGQVERLEMHRGRPIATMRVEHAARGAVSESVTFFADSIGEFQPSAVIGRRALVFLEPSTQDNPPFQIAFNGAAVLAAFRHGGEMYIAASKYGGLQLLPKQCMNVKYGLYECTARLSAVLELAHLRPMPVGASQPATFRIVVRRCAPCELQDWLERTANPGSDDCTVKIGADGVRCVRQGLASRKPFKAVVLKHGVDSSIADAVVFDGNRGQELQFDSSIEGGGSCAARVVRKPCDSVVVREGERNWLQCLGKEPEEVLCSQHDDRTESLGMPEDVSKLRCDSAAAQEGVYSSCQVRSGPPRSGEVIPPVTGRNLVCRGLAPHFFCEVE